MKKFISMLLAVMMVLSMIIVGTTTAFAENTATAYFVNTDNWAQVNCYVYSSSGGDLAGWPGTRATLVDEANGVYAFEPGSYDKLIWNNGNGNGKQTANLDTANCIGAYYEPKTETIYPTLEAALTAAGSAISYEYYVIGSEGLCGVNWAVSAQNGMTVQDDGTYVKTYENVPAGSYSFKIIDDAGKYHPDGMGNDSVAVVEVDHSTVVVTYDTTVGVGVAEVIAPTVDPTPSESDPTPSESDPTPSESDPTPSESDPTPSEPISSEPISSEPIESDPTEESRPVVENELYVQFTSNIGAHSDMVFNTTDVNEFKATVSLESALLIINGEGCVTYDPQYVSLKSLEVLNVNNAITNVTGIENGDYRESYFNFTDPSTPADFSTAKPIVEMTFDIVNYGNTEIMFGITELTAVDDVVLVENGGPADNFTATVALTAVGDAPITEPTEPSVVPVVPTLSKTNIKLKAAQTANLTVNNANGAAVKYTVKDKTVAKVSKNGKITALKKGETKITVAVGNKKLTCNVKVTTNPKLVNNKGKKVTKLTVVAGAKATKVYINGKVKSIKNSYSSNKTSVAKVSGNKKNDFIKVQGLKKGTANITVKVNGVKPLKLKVVVK